MKIIGLAGGSGSGKGAVSEIFKKFDIPSVDTDKVYRGMTEAMSECLEALRLEFGNEIISQSGTLDRKALSEVVFNSDKSTEKRKRLNEITHKFILEKTRSILKEYEKEGKRAALVDAPLLFESGFDKECDIIISVIADKETRINRIVKRDNISAEAAERRINSQLSDEELINKSHYIIINNGNLCELEVRVKEVAEQILKTEGEEK